MPFQPINFASIGPIGNPALRDFISTLAQGYKAGQLPEELLRVKQEEELRNALMQRKLSQEPERFSSEMESHKIQNALSNAQLDKMKQEIGAPFLGDIAPGAIGQAMWLDRIRKKYGLDSPEYLDAKIAHDAEINAINSIISRNDSLMNNSMQRILPQSEKTRVFAFGTAMGYDPTELSDRLSKGQTLKQLADEKGISLSDLKPSFALSNKDISNLKNRESFVKEIGYLEGVSSNALKEMGRTLNGYSPSQIWGAIKNEDSDKQGRFLAARALQPELAALRIKAAGGNVGIEAIREMQEKSLSNSKIFESTISPEAKEKMNQYLTKWLEEAVNTYQKSMLEGSKLYDGGNNKNKARLRFNPETKRIEI